MHASLACFVSGQQQQIFFPDFMPTFCWEVAAAGALLEGVDDACPMIESVARENGLEEILFISKERILLHTT